MALSIGYAGYGVWNSTNDVTSKVQEQYAGGQRTFFAKDIDYGDPSPGNRKYLYITWAKNEGFVQSGVVGQHDDRGIELPD